MKAFVFRPVRKGVRSSLWFARICLDGWTKTREVCLQVTQKRVAEEKLRAMVKEFELEAVGLSPAASVRSAAQKPLLEHLAMYLEAIAAAGKSQNTVSAYRRGISTFLKRTGWKTVGEASVAGFDRWRVEHEPSAKYANDVLGFLRTFFGWMIKRKLLAADPLVDVVKSKIRNDGCKRAAFTPEQLDRLCSCVPPVRAFAYRFAGYTGIRRGEMNQLTWGDFDLVGPTPSVLVRASISKNARTERLPLQPDVVALLLSMRPDLCQPFEWVFRNRVPNMDTFHRDLKRARIPKTDASGAKFDFHALRTTFITMLNAAGVAPRVAMGLARHSDMKLTMRTYTNANGLPLAAGVAALPSFSIPCAKFAPSSEGSETGPLKARPGAAAEVGARPCIVREDIEGTLVPAPAPPPVSAPKTDTPHDTLAGVVSGQNEAFPVASCRELAISGDAASVASRRTKGPPDFSGDPFEMVDPSRFELLTSSMPLRRSTN